jgi:hypothetical protein
MDRKRNGDGFTAGGTGLLARVAPLRRRPRTEAGSAGLLLVATVIALLWANSPFAASYDTFWHTPFAVRFVAECPPHRSKPRPNSGESCRHLGPMSDVGRQSLPDRSQEWRDRLRWVKLGRDEQLAMSVHLIVRWRGHRPRCGHRPR